MKEGFYEQIVTQSLQRQLSALQDEVQQRTSFGKADGLMVIGRYLKKAWFNAFRFTLILMGKLSSTVDLLK